MQGRSRGERTTATNAIMEASGASDDSVDENTGIFTQDDLDSVALEEVYEKKSDSGNKTENLSKQKIELENNDIANDDNDDDDDDDDDGDSSVDSFSSSQSGSSLSSMGSTSSEASLTLMQRQARNIARNERFLGSLKEKYLEQLGESQESLTKGAKGTSKGVEKSDSLSDNEDSHSRTQGDLGMIRGGTHRLFQCSLPRHMSSVKEINDATTTNNNHESLMRACQSYDSGIVDLEQRYPHRTIPIGKLHSILSSTISLTASVSSRVVPSSAASVYIPAPIFCMGSKGTGKTSVVCDIVGHLSSKTSSSSSSSSSSLTRPTTKIQPAYVDCSIVEPSTVERLVYTIYKQLKPSSSGPMVAENRKQTNKTKMRRKKRKRNIANFRLPTKAPIQDDANRKDESDDAKIEFEANQNRVLPSRKAKKAAIHKSVAYNANTYKSVHRKRTRGNNEDGYEDDGDEDDSDEEVVETLHSAILSLGRSLQKYYGSYLDDNGAYRSRGFRKKPKCGILVLDNAEELLSLSSASKKGILTSTATSGANNYLSELLLLPKIMKLNLTIVVVTKYCTLHMTRLNNATDPSKALGTISNGVHPIVVQFPAYKGNKVFTEILSTPENQKLVMGDSLMSQQPNSVSTMRQSLKNKLVRSFWNTVVQFASDSTRDIRDFQRLGRALWPSFVAPLHPSILKATLTASANKVGFGSDGLTRQSLSDPERYTKIEDEIVRILGNKFYPMVSSLASGNDSLTLLALDEDGSLPIILSSTIDSGDSGGKIVQDTNLGVTVSILQPYLRSCLLLAAFVCQHNKADRDRKFFSIHGNGRRKKSRAKEDLYGGNDEDLAFGSTSATMHSRGRNAKPGQQPKQVDQLRTLKLRPIPLERVFSIFVTLVRLNPSQIEDDNNDESIIDDLGSSRLYTDLSHLIDLGYLHLVKGNQPLPNAPSRILCTLTREEALDISKRIGIPLERYLL